MGSEGTQNESAARTAAQFATTHWSVVLAAGDSASPDSKEALEKLCRTYWYPLYAYVRRHGHNPADAQDVTQSFFVHLIEHDFFTRPHPNRGKFRSFLLGAFKRFIRDQDRMRRAQRRGGQIEFVTWDNEQAEQRLAADTIAGQDAGSIYEREWAVTVLDEAIKLLESECHREGKAEQFEILHPLLQGDRAESRQADLAARLGVGVGALKVAIHRMRRRYGELLRAVVAHTVPDPGDVDEELRYLVRMLDP